MSSDSRNKNNEKKKCKYCDKALRLLKTTKIYKIILKLSLFSFILVFLRRIMQYILKYDIRVDKNRLIQLIGKTHIFIDKCYVLIIITIMHIKYDRYSHTLT